MVLANAVYFRGEWEKPFREARTKEEAFTLSTGRQVKTPIMNARGLKVARYGAFKRDGSFHKTPRQVPRNQKVETGPGTEGFTMLELPYKGRELSMILLAPERADRLEAIETLLTLDKLEEWLKQLERRTTHVYLPKFRLEIDTDVVPVLNRMGMVRAFVDPATGKGADFRGNQQLGPPAVYRICAA